MRLPILISLAAIALLAPRAGASDVGIVSVRQGYRTAESFRRISEYFTGRENTGSDTVLRSQPSARAGYYFLARLDSHTAPVVGAKIRLSLVIPGSATPRVFEFVADIPAGARMFDVGATGTDWPSAEAVPVAWLLTVEALGGAELAHAQSFLWAKPDAPGANAK